MIQTAAHQATTLTLTSAPVSDLVVLTGVVIIVTTLLIAAVSTVLLKRSAGRQSRLILESSSQLAQHLEQLQGALAVADSRIAAVAARMEEQSRTAQGGATTSYNVAIRLARRGASRLGRLC